MPLFRSLLHAHGPWWTLNQRESQESSRVCSQCLLGIQSGQDRRGNNQEKVELSLSFRALKIMETAKEEKSYYSQAVGTHNLSWGVRSANTNCLARTLCEEAPPVTCQALLIHLSGYQSSRVWSQVCRRQLLTLNSQALSCPITEHLAASWQVPKQSKVKLACAMSCSPKPQNKLPHLRPSLYRYAKLIFTAASKLPLSAALKGKQRRHLRLKSFLAPESTVWSLCPQGHASKHQALAFLPPKLMCI